MRTHIYMCNHEMRLRPRPSGMFITVIIRKVLLKTHPIDTAERNERRDR